MSNTIDNHLYRQVSNDEKTAASGLLDIGKGWPSTNTHQQLQEQQPSMLDKLWYNFVKPPKLFEFLGPALNLKVEQWNEKMDEDGLFLQDDNLVKDERFDRDRQAILEKAEKLNRFLLYPNALEATKVGPYSFTELDLGCTQCTASHLNGVGTNEDKFTQTVTCVSDKEGNWITITSINNILMFRLKELGFEILCKPTEIKGKVVYSILRNIKDKGKVLRQGSELLKALTQKHCVIMHRDQAIYPWESVEHGKLLKKFIEHAYKQSQNPNTSPLRAIQEPALSLMASKDVNDLYQHLQKLNY